MDAKKYTMPSLSDPVGWSGQFERRQLERIKEEAAERKIPVSALVRACVVFMLDNERLLEMALKNGA